jgi:outer membrane protein assembly factor BamB
MKRFIAILMTILMLFSLFQGALRENVVKADSQPIEVRWKYDAGSGILFSPVVDTDGTIYIIAGSFYTLYAINSNGTLKWKYEVEYKVYFAPTIGKDGTIYLCARSPKGEYYLLAMSNDGTLRWKYNLEVFEPSGSPAIKNPPILDEQGIIYIETYIKVDYMKKAVLAVNKDGTLYGKYYSPGYFEYDLIMASKGIVYCNYIYNGSTVIRAIDPGNEVKWELKSKDTFPHIIPYKDTIYILEKSPNAFGPDIYLSAISLNGEVKWKYKADDYWNVDFYVYNDVPSPVVDNDGTVFTACTSPSDYEPFSIIYAINPNGTLKWKYKFSSRVFDYSGFMKLDENGILYVYGGDPDERSLYALDLNGNLKWTFSMHKELEEVVRKEGYLKCPYVNSYINTVRPTFLGIRNKKVYFQASGDVCIPGGSAGVSHVLLIEDGKLIGGVRWPTGDVYAITPYSCIGEDGTLYFAATYMLGNSKVDVSTLWAINFAIPEKEALTIVLQIGSSTFTVNGNPRTLDSPPIIKNGRTLVPIRAIIEALGGTVGWDATEKKVTVTLGSTTIELWIGKSIAKVNDINTAIDSANSKVVPEIINSRTMLPLRFVTENLGCDVQWDGTTKTITITYGG